MSHYLSLSPTEKKRERERREGHRRDGRGEKTRQGKGRDKTQENRAVERG